MGWTRSFGNSILCIRLSRLLLSFILQIKKKDTIEFFIHKDLLFSTRAKKNVPGGRRVRYLLLHGHFQAYAFPIPVPIL